MRLAGWVGKRSSTSRRYCVRIVAVELGRLDQAHDDGGTLSSTERSGKEPVRAPEGDGSDPVLEPVVVDRQIAIVQVTRQRCPAAQAVVDRLCSGRAFRAPGQRAGSAMRAASRRRACALSAAVGVGRWHQAAARGLRVRPRTARRRASGPLQRSRCGDWRTARGACASRAPCSRFRRRRRRTAPCSRCSRRRRACPPVPRNARA